ncbi:MAG TPA: hypothetical protein VK971_03625 [Thiohalobacter sp.]|nr:hypothetical protein [Thiohalobacter sp.]
MKYIVEYTLPYLHRVQVGIVAESEQAAIAKAERLFHEGEIWDDTPDVPLLFDDFEEDDTSGAVLRFTVVETVDESRGSWPEPDGSVLELRRRDNAYRAARMLVQAGRAGFDRKWLDQAYRHALQAID